MSGMKLPLNQVWDRTAALTGISRSTAQKIVEEKKMVNYWASDIARDEMPEPVVIYLDSDDDDFATDTASEIEIPSTVIKLLNKYMYKTKQKTK